MIEARVTHDGEEIARITFVKMARDAQGDSCSYIIQFGVERLGPTSAVGLYTRHITAFPRTKANALGLLTAALNALTQEELSLDAPTSSSDLARRQRGVGAKIQAWVDRLRDN